MSTYNYSENPGHALRMEAFDSLPPSIRKDINENGPSSQYIIDYKSRLIYLNWRNKNGV